ncbi:MAG: hypothetical protein U9R25_17020 [Chloroflexota bacterium]|nr:hypothetical protein [Chloroflexota bacterium]
MIDQANARIKSLAKDAEGQLSSGASPARRLSFAKMGSQGFGDRYNTWAWSMIWWRGCLFVGTNRAILCAERAATANGLPMLSKFPFAKYPPDDPDAGCPPDSTDLPLRAEIWRWTPEIDQWDRVYQAPEDVPIPGHPGKFVGRDIGYRGMTSFVEPDGTEALYVSGVTAQLMYANLVPPRLLRTTDGNTFEAIPQPEGYVQGEVAPGEFRGMSTFRNILSFDGRMFIVAGGIHGDGVLLEGDNPAAGTECFRQVSPVGHSVFETVVFNGHIYAGTRDPINGYAVLKMDAAGSPPYKWTTVVSNGAFLPIYSLSVISMFVFRNRLYVGTDRPGEIIRINPDDSWELVVGSPRETPDGWKYPISGLDFGFCNWLNGHIWRMEEYQGKLYIGTMKLSTHLRTLPDAEPVLKPNYGFDLYETTDGRQFAPLTTSGFGDKFSFGIRSFASGPAGLFVGTANSWYGLQVWRAQDSGRNGTEMVGEGSDGLEMPAPYGLELDSVDGRVVLSWQSTGSIGGFRIWRAEVNDIWPLVKKSRFLTFARWAIRSVRKIKPELYFPPLPKQIWVPDFYEEIGTTDQQIFVDRAVEGDRRYLYYVVAENEKSQLSAPSNLVAAPLMTPPVTFENLFGFLENRTSALSSSDGSSLDDSRQQLEAAQERLSSGDTAGASAILDRLAFQGDADARILLSSHSQDELLFRLGRLRQRIDLFEAGYLPMEAIIR